MDTLQVLVVDDEAGMRHSVKRALANHAIELPDIEGAVTFEVQTAESGERALEVLATRTFDIMLLDHKMGGMTGVDVLEQLRQRELDMLVIMITAFATIETAVRATKSGAFDFIAKPFTPDELKETIRKTAAHLVIQRQARRLAAEKRQVRFEFISVLGHELKAPLGAIESYLNLLHDRVAGNDLKSYDQMIERCLLRAGGMRKLIADLLDLTRIESGQKKRELATVDISAIAEHAIEGVLPTASQHGVTINLERAGNLTMTADQGELSIVLNNLVSNAVKYNRDNGRVDVSLAGDDDWVTITVQDTGIGLTEQEAAKLFKDFARIKNDKTRDIPGSGLGLSIVKKIAGLYGGNVTLQSQPDTGSTFTVQLSRNPQGSSDESPGSNQLAARN
ncbi:MAG: hybrid sensor histidine kinase/response regulator [Phycisphaerae bacterium]|nr:hybrid sensor histidine kinase/response regulator [Phycisphaerae bacterium]